MTQFVYFSLIDQYTPLRHDYPRNRANLRAPLLASDHEDRYYMVNSATHGRLRLPASMTSSIQIMIPANTVHFCERTGLILPEPDLTLIPRKAQYQIRLDLEALLTYYDTPPVLDKLLTQIAKLCTSGSAAYLRPTRSIYCTKLLLSTLTCAEGGPWQLTGDLIGAHYKHHVSYFLATGFAGGGFSGLVRFLQTRYSAHYLPLSEVFFVAIATANADILWQPIINACMPEEDGTPTVSVIPLTAIGCTVIFWMTRMICRFGHALYQKPTLSTVTRLAKDLETWKDTGAILAGGDAAGFCVTIIARINGKPNPFTLIAHPASAPEYLSNFVIAGFATSLGGLFFGIFMMLYTYWQDYHNGRTTWVPSKVFQALTLMDNTSTIERSTEMRISRSSMMRHSLYRNGHEHTYTPPERIAVRSSPI